MTTKLWKNLHTKSKFKKDWRSQAKLTRPLEHPNERVTRHGITMLQSICKYGS